MKETRAKKGYTLEGMNNRRTPSRRPLRADAQRNRQLLLDAAHELLTTEGPDVPLEEIARRAGVGIGTLYRHFPTRYDLIAAMYAGRMGELIELAGRLSQAQPPRDALFEWLRAEARHMATYRPLKIFLMNDATAKKPAGVNWKEKLHEAGGALLERAQQAGTVRKEIDAAQLLKLVHAVITTADNSDLESVDQMLEVVIDGLRSQPE